MFLLEESLNVIKNYVEGHNIHKNQASLTFCTADRKV